MQISKVNLSNLIDLKAVVVICRIFPPINIKKIVLKLIYYFGKINH